MNSKAVYKVMLILLTKLVLYYRIVIFVFGYIFSVFLFIKCIFGSIYFASIAKESVYILSFLNKYSLILK